MEITTDELALMAATLDDTLEEEQFKFFERFEALEPTRRLTGDEETIVSIDYHGDPVAHYRKGKDNTIILEIIDDACSPKVRPFYIRFFPGNREQKKNDFRFPSRAQIVLACQDYLKGYDNLMGQDKWGNKFQYKEIFENVGKDERIPSARFDLVRKEIQTLSRGEFEIEY